MIGFPLKFFFFFFFTEATQLLDGFERLLILGGGSGLDGSDCVCGGSLTFVTF